MHLSSKTNSERHFLPTVPITPFDAYVVEVVVEEHEGDKKRAQLKKVFGSSMGARVRQATLFPIHIHFTFDIPAAGMKSSLQALMTLIPNATINQIYPREFEYSPRRKK